jgi:SPASM domain peptide maturase of grasp-with-spasm system
MNHINSNYFRLFADCIPVRGSKRSVICDLKRNIYFFVPNVFLHFLSQVGSMTYNDIAKLYDEEMDIVNGYFDHMEKHDLGFWTSLPDAFPSLNCIWDTPELVNNAIVEIDNLKEKDIYSTFHGLMAVGCKHIEIHAYESKSIEKILTSLDILKKSSVRSLSAFIKFRSTADVREIEKILEFNPRLLWVVMHSCPENIKIETNDKRLNFSTMILDDKCHCGKVLEPFFVVNIRTYTESLHHNSCLNRKIAIDIDGNIKNCPSMSQSFGNIRDTTLREALDHPDFKKYWNITKDQIAVCKDCEFRYICTDCRAYLENPEDQYSKPLKCGYNPYTCEWEEWSTNPLKQKAIDYYGMRDVLPEFKLKPDHVPAPRQSADPAP